MKQDSQLEIKGKENGDNKSTPKIELKLKDDGALPANSKPVRIPMKEMREDNAQGRTTGDATPGEGPSTGVGTGQQQEIPTVREQRMGGCTIQLVGCPEMNRPTT